MAKTFNLEAAKGVLLDQYTTDELIALLDITAEDLLDRFEDIVIIYLRQDDGEFLDEDESDEEQEDEE